MPADLAVQSGAGVAATAVGDPRSGGGVPSLRVFVSDLRHFLDLRDDAPGPARRIAEQFSLIVRAATAGDAGLCRVSAVGCRRRPGRRACPGHIAVLRSDVPPSIEWRCTSCGDEGVISGWEHSPFDLRTRTTDVRPSDDVQVVIEPDVAATLQSSMLIDTAGERLVFRARRAHPSTASCCPARRTTSTS